MKKLFTAFALGLLLVGCARQYDDTELRNRVTTLETKVGNLEANVKALQDATADGMFVQSVEELTENGKVVGVTVTYTTGKVVTFQISGAGAETNLSAIRNASGVLCWALNGKIIQVDGKDLPVGQTPSFSVKDGHLLMTVDGKTTDLGAMGGGLGDAIFKDIKVTADAVVLTLDDNSTLEIPFAKAFKLVIAKTQYAVTSTDPIEIPYTVENKTANTVVDVFTDANYEATVDASKITVTPLVVAKGSALAYADSQVGLTSIVKLTFGAEAELDKFEITDTDINYVAEAKDATVEAHAVSNIAFDVKPQVDWIHFVETRAQNYTIVLKVDDNPTEEIRTGEVKIVRTGTDETLQTITIAQKAGEAQPAEPDQELFGKVLEITPELSENWLLEKPIENLAGASTFEIRFYARSWHTNGMPNRLFAFEDSDEHPAVMLRFSNGNQARPGQLHLSCDDFFGGAANAPQVTKDGQPYIFETEKWHTLSIVNDGSSLSVYDNGVFINRYEGSVPEFTLRRLEFGMSWDENWDDTGYSTRQLFDGYIDYFRVWNVTRSESEIKTGLCDVASNAEGLVGYWRFNDEPDNSYMLDRTGNNDIDWDAMSQMDGAAVRKVRTLGDAFKAARKDFDGNICAGTGGGTTPGGGDQPDPDPDPEPTGNVKAIYWGNAQAAAWYKEFNRAIALPEGYSMTIHFYYDEAKQQRLGNFGDKGEAPCNMLRFGEAGNNNQLEWMVDTGGDRVKIRATVDAVPGQWNAVTLTAGADGYRMYINGQAAGSDASAYRSGTSFQAFEFANSWGTAYRSAFDGALCYMSLWSKQLSAEEVAANVFTTPSGSGLEAFWPMNEGEGFVFADKTGKYDDIDLHYMTRCDDEVNYVDVDVTPYVEWREYPALKAE